MRKIQLRQLRNPSRVTPTYKSRQYLAISGKNCIPGTNEMEKISALDLAIPSIGRQRQQNLVTFRQGF
jgi:hypothetical protein